MHRVEKIFSYVFNLDFLCFDGFPHPSTVISNLVCLCFLPLIFLISLSGGLYILLIVSALGLFSSHTLLFFFFFFLLYKLLFCQKYLHDKNIFRVENENYIVDKNRCIFLYFMIVCKIVHDVCSKLHLNIFKVVPINEDLSRF